jgi:peptide/nickel transport system substrate-binding protein
MLTRREFMKRTALGGAGVCLGSGFLRMGWAQGAVKKVVIGQGVDMASLDPHGHVTTFNFGTWKHIMEPLIRFDYASRRYQGVLAESWKAESTEWTFKLRKGVKFHNGDDFTAQDVAFSIARIKDGSKQVPILAPVKEAKVVDDYTVKIITHAPFSPLLSRLKQPVMVNHRVYQQQGKEAIPQPIGTGPFKFVEWVRGSHFVVQRNEQYWRKPAQIDQIIWKPIFEDAARVTALEAESIDVATNIPPHEADRLAGLTNVKIDAVPAMRSMHIGLPMRFKPFQDQRVRLALNYAVDVDSLVKYVLEGKANRTIGVSGPNDIGHNPDIKPFPYDPNKAKSLLAQAGYPNGFDVDCVTTSGRYVKDRESAEAIANQLAKVGIRVNVVIQEYSVWWSGVLDGKHPMFVFGAFNEEEPDLFLSLYFETGVTKRLEYSNPQMDRLIREQRQVFDPAEREKLLRDLMKKIYEDAPTVPLWHPQDIYGVNRKLTWKAPFDEEMMFYEASIRG